MSFRCFPIALFGALLFSSAASATTIRGFTTRGLVTEAAVVVRGTVLAQKGLYSADKSRIYTESTVRVTDAVLGKPLGELITIRQLGGAVGDVSMHVSGVARIKAGEDVVLFLRTDGARYYLVGMAQGKFGVSGKKGHEVVSRTLSGLEIKRKGVLVGLPPLAKPAAPQTWKALRADIVRFDQEQSR